MLTPLWEEPGSWWVHTATLGTLDAEAGWSRCCWFLVGMGEGLLLPICTWASREPAVTHGGRGSLGQTTLLLNPAHVLPVAVALDPTAGAGTHLWDTH